MQSLEVQSRHHRLRPRCSHRLHCHGRRCRCRPNTTNTGRRSRGNPGGPGATPIPLPPSPPPTPPPTPPPSRPSTAAAAARATVKPRRHECEAATTAAAIVGPALPPMSTPYLEYLTHFAPLPLPPAPPMSTPYLEGITNFAPSRTVKRFSPVAGGGLNASKVENQPRLRSIEIGEKRPRGATRSSLAFLCHQTNCQYATEPL